MAVGYDYSFDKTNATLQETILKIGVPFGKYNKKERKDLYDEIKEQIKDYNLIPIIVPEDVLLETVYI